MLFHSHASLEHFCHDKSQKTAIRTVFTLSGNLWEIENSQKPDARWALVTTYPHFGYFIVPQGKTRHCARHFLQRTALPRVNIFFLFLVLQTIYLGNNLDSSSQKGIGSLPCTSQWKLFSVTVYQIGLFLKLTTSTLSMSCWIVFLMIALMLVQSLDFSTAKCRVTRSRINDVRLLNITSWSGMFTPASRHTNFCCIHSPLSEFNSQRRKSWAVVVEILFFFFWMFHHQACPVWFKNIGCNTFLLFVWKSCAKMNSHVPSPVISAAVGISVELDLHPSPMTKPSWALPTNWIRSSNICAFSSDCSACSEQKNCVHLSQQWSAESRETRAFISVQDVMPCIFTGRVGGSVCLWPWRQCGCRPRFQPQGPKCFLMISKITNQLFVPHFASATDLNPTVHGLPQLLCNPRFL